MGQICIQMGGRFLVKKNFRFCFPSIHKRRALQGLYEKANPLLSAGLWQYTPSSYLPRGDYETFVGCSRGRDEADVHGADKPVRALGHSLVCNVLLTS